LETVIHWRAVTSPTCPSCGQPRLYRFCGTCGERAVEPDELSFRRFIRLFAEEVVPGLDDGGDATARRVGGRIYRTVYTLVRYPGQLTADYIAGRRRPYLKPIQVFLTISVIFFLFGHNYFQFRLRGYEFVPLFGQTASAVAAQQQRMRLTPAQYEQRFNDRLEAQKKAVMALTVPLFALGVMPLFRRRRYGEHLVFSIHFFALQLLFMITVLFVFFRLMVLIIGAIDETHRELATTMAHAIDSEWIVVVLVYVPMYAYLVKALRRVYGGKPLVNAIRGFVLVLWHIAMLVFVFRNSLFITTFYSLKWFD
jgi:hypothetical protein